MVKLLSENDIRRIINRRDKKINKRIDSIEDSIHKIMIKMNDLEIIIKKRLKNS